MSAKKAFYKIGEACKELDIQPYVLRYWETEFPVLNPTKSKSGQRVFSSEDLEVIRRIKELLYEEGYTIAGAKKKLASESPSSRKAKEPAAADAAPKEPRKEQAGKKEAAVSQDEQEEKAAPQSDTTEFDLARLKRGIRKARREAQSILDLLDTGSAKR